MQPIARLACFLVLDAFLPETRVGDTGNSQASGFWLPDTFLSSVHMHAIYSLTKSTEIHTGGNQFALGDGSERFISEDINANTFGAISAMSNTWITGEF